MALSTIPIVSAVNSAYLLPLAVMLQSLQQHLRPGVRPVLYLVHGGLPESGLAVIRSLAETHTITPTPAQLRALPCDARLPGEAAAPLLLADLLPAGLERVLFLDADLLILDDVAQLWELPLPRAVLAAVPDGAVPRCSSPRGVKGWQCLGIAPGAPYWNAGVMLIHLNRWRRRDVTRRALHYLESTPANVDFLHQEALNAVLWQDWMPLDQRWNLLASHAGRPFHPDPHESWRNAAIVHFAGRLKPWRMRIGGPFAEPYQRVLQALAPRFPSEHPAVMDHLKGLYDRRLRDALYPIENFLWQRRYL